MSQFRLCAALFRWITGRHDGNGPGAFPYGRNLRPVLIMLLVVVALEGGVLELVLGLILRGTPWPWVCLAVHAYAMVLLAGFLASLRTRPHLLGSAALRLRDGVFTELVLPLAEITEVRTANRPGPPRSGYRVAGTETTLAHGAANVTLSLGEKSVHFTVDEPRRFLAALTVCRSGSSPAAPRAT